MLQPKKSKFRKMFRGSNGGMTYRGIDISFGEYGIQALSGGWVSNRQIESARKALTFFTKKGGRVWIRIFPDKPISKKPAEVRMGGGKGDISEYVAVIRKGRILFEMGGVSEDMAIEAIRRAGAKLSVATRFVKKS